MIPNLDSRVITSEWMTMDDPDHVVASYHRPLWRRLLVGRTVDAHPVTLQQPSDQIVQLPNGAFVMHPVTWSELRGKLGR